ncbi:MAG: tripartite tricarboxylate transporter substrate-binding protein, partial [Burkholderiales bacterium]
MSVLNRIVPAALAAVAAVLMVFAAPAAHAQQHWPDKPIRFVVPYPPGGGTDVIARIVQERFQATLGQPIIIENRGGAAGSLGTDVVA